jgi:CRP/FNR family transcriptional regulator, cyclic AMP receptor protein
MMSLAIGDLMTHAVIGYIASALVLCTFCTRTMLPLRVIALGSNLSFIAYGALEHLYPVLILHVALLPLNAWRLAEILRLSRRVQRTIDDGEVFGALLPFARRISMREHETIMRRGDPSSALYLVLEGSLWVEEAETELGPGSIVGEMGVLSRAQRRTATVTARTDCALGRVSAEDFQRVYYTNPSLGLALVRLIIDRLSREVEARRMTALEA